MKLLPLTALVVALPLNAQTGADLTAIDKTVSPCTNFYRYACGMWIKNNPLPSDQPRWGRFNVLAAQNMEVEKKILEQAASPNLNRNPTQQKIGDYYAACMDEAAIDRKGVSPLNPLLDQIEALKNKKDLTAELVRLHRAGILVFFALGPQPDPKNAAINIASISQDGIAMPDRDYYLKDDAKTVEIRKQYLEHVRKMFELLDRALGKPTDDTGKQSDAVLKIETALARNSLDGVALRNPDNTYHPMSIQQLADLTPDLGWREYLTKIGIPPVTLLNVAEPDFVRGLAAIFADNSLEDLKTYITWHALHDSMNRPAYLALLDMNVMPKSFEDENWHFNMHILTGAPEQEPRWKRCVKSADSLLGEGLGQEFVRVAFSAASKDKTLQMVSEIEAEMAKVIQSADWMSPATKGQAFTKLHEVANKIGYPDKWLDYSNVKIVPGDAFGNNQRANAFETERQLNKVGKPVDKGEWSMTPPTVDAYYNPPENNINFPAGILQPPFYDPNRGDPGNYGAIGMVVGHELTHGFDDQGRRYDGCGNLRDWWTKEDANAFDQRSDCIVKEYGAFSPVSGVTVNGRLTLGENAADNGGIRLAFMALMDRMAGHPMEKVDGYTPQQQFFLGFAQIWCGSITPEAEALRAKIDPHSPREFRVNGTLQNMPEFSTAFSCKLGDPMVSDKACRIW